MYLRLNEKGYEHVLIGRVCGRRKTMREEKPENDGEKEKTK